MTTLPPPPSKPIPPQLRVLFFDVFGTCVMQRGPVAEALHAATQEALASPTAALTDEVRQRAGEMTYEAWDEFGSVWNRDVEALVKASIATHRSVDWRAIDAYRFASLHKLLARRGLIIPGNIRPATGPDMLPVERGSLWDAAQLRELGAIWHRLPPWPDTVRGLDLLNRKFTTVTLSNTHTALMQDLVDRGQLPFQHVYTSEMFGSYKPNAAVYLGAAEKLGVRPEECALVAAHLGDLKGAKACRFYAINVVRPLEEKAPALKAEGIPDLIVDEGEGGFVTLAKRLGIQVD